MRGELDQAELAEEFEEVVELEVQVARTVGRVRRRTGTGIGAVVRQSS